MPEGISMTERIITGSQQEQDSAEFSLRPQVLDDFIGQQQAKQNLRVFIEAARGRGEALDHVLFFGPPGLGKTTLAQIMARELGVNFKATSGPILTKAGDLAAILTNLEAKDVLFIDEIHRLSPAVEEILYPAMEDFKLDLMIGEGPAARAIRIDLPQFTLVGATTRLGLLSNPLRDRFGIPVRLEFYTPEELRKVIQRGAALLNADLTEDGADEIARRSRGTPRIAVRLLKRVRDFAHVDGNAKITAKAADKALRAMEVDNMGLDSADHRYLKFILEHYMGGPVGIETIAAGLSEQRDSLEETIEPYLIQCGFLQRTPRGRMATPLAFKHLGFALPNAYNPSQFELLEE
jgi:Holliday junction DNA helicase RuvB